MSAADTATAHAIARATKTIITGTGAQLAGRQRQRSGAPHPTGAPVLRDSLEEGTFENGLFFVRMAPGEPDQLFKLAKAALEAGKKLKRAVRQDPTRKLSVRERAIAALTDTAVHVYEVLCGLARRTGRVFPSYDALADMTGRGRGNIVRGMRLLETAGFLVRQRRFKRVAGTGAGPRYAQTSNVYRPTLPKRILGLLPRWLRPPPVPVDEQQREVERLDESEHHLAQLTCRELTRVTVSAGPLADVLARLGDLIDDREARVPIPFATAF